MSITVHPDGIPLGPEVYVVEPAFVKVPVALTALSQYTVHPVALTSYAMHLKLDSTEHPANIYE